jgi:DNA topoisomerase-3
MIAILTDNARTGMDIARIAGATEQHDGYMSGNGYIVTWALGRLVLLAPPECYEHSKPSAPSLPILPAPFQLSVRRKKTAKGMVTDKTAMKQLNVIDRVFNECDSIIVATEASGEGQLVFQYIYDYLGHAKPYKRLWISSLTDEALQKGMANLREGSDYDSLYRAADCREKADWLIEENTGRALTALPGMENHSPGRIQTPVLALIGSRYRENRNFVPTSYRQLHITLEKDGMYRRFRLMDERKEKTGAENLYARLRSCPVAKIIKVERKTVLQAQPLLYDLVTLQTDCNIRLGFPAGKTEETARSLYRKKLISFPGTSCRHIPEEMFREIPSLLRMVLRMDRFKHLEERTDTLRPAGNPVNGRRITGHPAIIITGDYPGELSIAEQKVYHMIAGRMLEAFGPPCEKESLLMEASLDDVIFRSHSQKIRSAGWRGVFNHPEDREEDEKNTGEGTAEFKEGEEVKTGGYSLTRKKTMPKPLYTEAVLLAAMEGCGKTVTDEAMKEGGLGTPATRAAIIETLLKEEYICRYGKSLAPTQKGLFIYDAVKDMRIADARIAGQWEKRLWDIEKNTLSSGTFMKAIEGYTRRVTKEVLSLQFPGLAANAFTCPKCGTGKVVIRHKLSKCDNGKCGFLIFGKFLNRELTKGNVRQLLASGSTKLIKGFKGKKDRTFDARLAFDENYNITFSFPKTKGKGKGKKKAVPKPPAEGKRMNK